ncbi:MAG: tRNA dihydrouridine synthase DusB [Oscillospiraceae bacterium]|jgi:nifR3 family TIM-barrel protein|nr:tRNA dihydrouridine synthase DusB [Oscillospiraceae bacterium]
MLTIAQKEMRGAALAPMAGVADKSMRALCVEQGACFCVGEMVSAKALALGDKKSAQLLQIGNLEHPAGVQLFGMDPDVFCCALPQALAVRPAFLDINMGCPAPKIVGGGAGAALMKDPVRAAEIVRSTVREIALLGAELPVSVKCRVGWDENDRNVVDFAKRVEAAGAAFLTIHGRTRRQMYAPPVDYRSIAAVKSAVKIPVIANGNVTDGQTAKEMLARTGCDLVMVGRGAMGRPWVFAQIAASLNGRDFAPPSIAEQMGAMLRHVRMLCADKGERIGMCEARKHAAWYLKGMRGAAQKRAQITSMVSIDQLEHIAEELIAENAD